MKNVSTHETGIPLLNDAVQLLTGETDSRSLECTGPIWDYDNRLDISENLKRRILITAADSPPNHFGHVWLYRSGAVTVEMVEACFGGRDKLNPIASGLAGRFASVQKFSGDLGFLAYGRKALMFLGPPDKAFPVLMWREAGKEKVQADLAGPNTLLAEGTIVLMQARKALFGTRDY